MYAGLLQVQHLEQYMLSEKPGMQLCYNTVA